MFTALTLGMHRFISGLELNILTVAGSHQKSIAQSFAKDIK